MRAWNEKIYVYKTFAQFDGQNQWIVLDARFGLYPGYRIAYPTWNGAIARAFQLAKF